MALLPRSGNGITMMSLGSPMEVGQLGGVATGNPASRELEFMTTTDNN